MQWFETLMSANICGVETDNYEPNCHDLVPNYISFDSALYYKCNKKAVFVCLIVSLFCSWGFFSDIFVSIISFILFVDFREPELIF